MGDAFSAPALPKLARLADPAEGKGTRGFAVFVLPMFGKCGEGPWLFFFLVACPWEKGGDRWTKVAKVQGSIRHRSKFYPEPGAQTISRFNFNSIGRLQSSTRSSLWASGYLHPHTNFFAPPLPLFRSFLTDPPDLDCRYTMFSSMFNPDQFNVEFNSKQHK